MLSCKVKGEAHEANSHHGSAEKTVVCAGPFLAVFLKFALFQSKKLTEKFTKVKQAALINSLP